MLLNMVIVGQRLDFIKDKSSKDFKKYLDKASVLVDTAEKRIQNAKPHQLEQTIKFLSEPVYLLKYQIAFSQYKFLEAITLSEQWLEHLNDLEANSKPHNNPPLVLSRSKTEHFKGTALMLLANYASESFTDEERKMLYTRADHSFLRSIYIFNYESTQSGKNYDANIARVQGDLAHSKFGQGKTQEASEWLERMARHGGMSQILAEISFSNDMQQHYQHASRYDQFVINSLSHNRELPETPSTTTRQPGIN